MVSRRPTRREVPKLHEFANRFLDGYARANRHKPSGVAAKETILRVHLVPLIGNRRLDQITNEDVHRLKHRLRHRSPKTVNNVLTTLSKLLKVARRMGGDRVIAVHDQTAQRPETAYGLPRLRGLRAVGGSG